MLALAACSTPQPYATTVGALKPGATLAVRAAQTTVNAYQPVTGQRRNLFTISATAPANGTPPPTPTLRVAALGVIVNASQPLASLLVRVPDGVNLVVDCRHGDVNVTDITGNARILTGEGNVKVMLPGYAQAAVRHGNISVTMGATQWPGLLRFSSERGDVEVRINAKAAFHVHLHTANGALFTDFGLRGNSQGSSETIDGDVNGGGEQGVDVETNAGAIRLLRLTPQP